MPKPTSHRAFPFVLPQVPLPRAVETLLRSTRDRSAREHLGSVLLLLTAMALVGWLARTTSGTSPIFLNAAHLPIALAAYLYGARGGLLAGLVAGVLLGPLLPLDTVTASSQPVGAWLARGGIFVLGGVLVGGLTGLLRDRLERQTEMSQALGEAYARNLRQFASLVADRDEDATGHCERLAQNAVAIGSRLGLPESELKHLYWAGLLHDVGKIGVPESVLQKPGKLLLSEFLTVRRHARLGYEILSSLGKPFEPVAEGVLAHHERWDGGGYPTGAKGEAIPLFGRILAVVDAYEAMTSYRPYRVPMADSEAVRAITEGAGSQFDPALVETFLQLHAQGQIAKDTTPSPLFGSLEAHASDTRDDGDPAEMPGTAPT